MPETPRPLTPRQKALRWGLWWLTLAAWTAVLVSQRAPVAVAAVTPPDLRFWVAKTAHVCGYAVLAVLAGCLPVQRGPRIAWWLFLVFHAGLTEFLQQFVPGRHPSLRDVGLDVAGITLGLVVLWAWQRLRRA